MYSVHWIFFFLFWLQPRYSLAKSRLKCTHLVRASALEQSPTTSWDCHRLQLSCSWPERQLHLAPCPRPSQPAPNPPSSATLSPKSSHLCQASPLHLLSLSMPRPHEYPIAEFPISLLLHTFPQFPHSPSGLLPPATLAELK